MSCIAASASRWLPDNLLRLPKFAIGGRLSRQVDAADPLGASGENISAVESGCMRGRTYIRVPAPKGCRNIRQGVESHRALPNASALLGRSRAERPLLVHVRPVPVDLLCQGCGDRRSRSLGGHRSLRKNQAARWGCLPWPRRLGPLSSHASNRQRSSGERSIIRSNFVGLNEG